MDLEKGLNKMIAKDRTMVNTITKAIAEDKTMVNTITKVIAEDSTLYLCYSTKLTIKLDALNRDLTSLSF